MLPVTQLVALSVVLAIDACAVSAALAAAGARRLVLLQVVGCCAFFQAAFMAIGGFGGEWLADAASHVDHWVAFLLLMMVGGRIIFGNMDEEVRPTPGPVEVITLGVATSIDALAAGVSIPMMHLPIALASLTSGLITFGLAGAAAAFGRAIGGRLGSIAMKVGGLVLVALGVRILVSHGVDHGLF